MPFRIMRNIFIFHGTMGHPGENWFPWLKGELEGLGCNVIVPQFPTPENQTPETWFMALKQYEGFLGPDTILVGHSLGGTFLLRVLEKYQAKAAFIVSASAGVLPIKFIEGDMPFLKGGFDWQKIRANCKRFCVFHADKDEIVSPENGELVAKSLGTKAIVVKGAGHFNAKAGYVKFGLLLEKIKKEV
jgi:predicted alpha/beta hydrolase family esterase